MQLPRYLHRGMEDRDAFISRNIVLEQRLPPPPLPSYNQLHSSLPGVISSAVGQMHFYLLVSYCSKSPSVLVASPLQQVPSHRCGLQGTECTGLRLSLWLWHTVCLPSLATVTFVLLQTQSRCRSTSHVLFAWKKSLLFL